MIMNSCEHLGSESMFPGFPMKAPNTQRTATNSDLGARSPRN